MSRRSVAAIVTAILVAASCAPATLPSGPRTVPPAPTPAPTQAPATPPTTTPAATTAPTTAPSAPVPTPGATPSPGQIPSSALPTPTASASPAPTQAVPGWVAAGSMVTTRLTSHALLLPDGRVLVVGNDDDEQVRDDTAAAELFDPTTTSWSTTGSLNRPRGWFAAIALADGRVLVAGGRNQGTPWADAAPETVCDGQDPASYSSAYVWDSAGAEWTRTGLLSVARTDPAIARLADGRVLVAGGYFYTGPQESRNGAVVLARSVIRPNAAPRVDVDLPPFGYAWATAELFDPTTGTWSATGSMTYARSGAAAATLTDGRVLVVGAEDSGFRPVGNPADAFITAEIYDPATGAFALTGSLPGVDWAPLLGQGAPIDLGDPAPVAIGTLVGLDGGDALLVGTAGWWKHAGEITRSFRYDGSSGRWTEVGEPYLVIQDESTGGQWESAAVNRVGAVVTRLSDGRVLVAGGRGSVGFSGGFVASAEAYDPGSDTWTDLPPLPAPLADGSALTLADGSALVVGGAHSPEEAFAACNEPAGTADPLRFQP